MYTLRDGELYKMKLDTSYMVFLYNEKNDISIIEGRVAYIADTMRDAIKYVVQLEKEGQIYESTVVVLRKVEYLQGD